jgi:hypothetical protein
MDGLVFSKSIGLSEGYHMAGSNRPSNRSVMQILAEGFFGTGKRTLGTVGGFAVSTAVLLAFLFPHQAEVIANRLLHALIQVGSVLITLGLMWLVVKLIFKKLF